MELDYLLLFIIKESNTNSYETLFLQIDFE